MVKLRSGKSYIIKEFYNKKVFQFNDLIEKFKNKYGNIKHNNIVKAEHNKKKHILNNALKNYREIIKLNHILEIYTGKRGGKYYMYNNRKYYITADKFCKNSLKRIALYEELWLKISKFISMYTKLFNLNNDIKYIKNNKFNCLICYTYINKADELTVCKSNNILHVFHKNCFKLIPINKQDHVFNYAECPYCKKHNIDIHTIYKII